MNRIENYANIVILRLARDNLNDLDRETCIVEMRNTINQLEQERVSRNDIIGRTHRTFILFYNLHVLERSFILSSLNASHVRYGHGLIANLIAQDQESNRALQLLKIAFLVHHILAEYPAASVTPEFFSLNEMYARQFGFVHVIRTFTNPVMRMVADRDAIWTMREDLHEVIETNRVLIPKYIPRNP